MIFRQLYDSVSSTYTYLLADEHSGQAILIDPVFEQVTRDLAMLRELELKLKIVADTHAHADHVTAAWLLKQHTGCWIASSAAAGAENVDLPLKHGDKFGVQGVKLEVRATPGHTAGCLTYVLDDYSMAFTGDALLIRGCGRSDFQQGDASRLYHSITEQIFSLPDDCAIYPAHDYNGRTRSSVAEEKLHNPRVGGNANETDFVQYMKAMQLPHPKKIDEALPANMRSGKPEDGKLPDEPDWADIRISFAGIPEVTPEWVVHNQPSVTIIDVREAEEVEQDISILSNAISIPLNQLRDRLSEIPGDKPIVTLCRSGKRSSLAYSILKSAGFDKVANIRGGILNLPAR
ncbi:MBL fold metallo-hydrolase [Pseudohongiella sp. SYSU M77423]|uniref:MBL fold metallo-hydrolase n=1 Tax=unclassified Pseudohongiella TaxID=2629611 RepID=UPI000C8E94DA|nr:MULTISPECIES: MBL fold metallo-hydrolase [unclassified Pseudohongiella]MAO41772.1 MBL fold metallo-hydrolase [Pseudohongiella sp.]MDH7944679.1 MBL fold metallo-hydrolase [Pseudohongiella sp. SYSU M77423]HBX37074.1 MBL fold metallo-hydrolase [Pseudohongiella sp.]|tara:strand:- start:36484 stop:37524 length:1041 start_codon:yes stop_codon:yes gene_type:complete